MKVILIQDVKNLGNRGLVKEVKDGYAMNFLIPNKLALEATPSNIKLYEAAKKSIERREAQELEKANEMSGRLGKVSLSIARKCGEDDKLFGSVTSSDIQVVLQEQGIVIDKRDIVLDEPLKSLGVYDVPVKVYKSILGKVKVWVVKEGD